MIHTMDNDMHVLTIVFHEKELMKEIKIGARLSSNELTTKLQKLSREAERRAEADLLSDSDTDENETGFIEIDASVNLELKKWKRQINMKILADNNLSCNSEEDEDDLSSNQSQEDSQQIKL